MSIYIKYCFKKNLNLKKSFKKNNFTVKHFKVFKTPQRITLIFIGLFLLINDNTEFKHVLKGHLTKNIY